MEDDNKYLELSPGFKSLLWKTVVYAAIGLLGAGVGRFLPEDPPLHPTALEAIQEIPPRVIVLEQNGPYKILLDQATGVQFLRTPSAICPIPGTPAKVETPTSLEDLFKQ